MAHFKKAFPSKYLAVADLDAPIVATIKSVGTENVGTGEDQESKLVVTFREEAKALVLNMTRADAIAQLAKHPDTDRWSGTVICISKGNTTYKGKRTPCIVVGPPAAAGLVDAVPTLETAF